MVRTLPKWVVLSSALLAGSLPCLGQKPTFIPLVPAASWRMVSSQNLPVDVVSNYRGDPAIERECGVKMLGLRTYRLGNAEVHVVVEPASDASAAYALLTYYQTESMTPEKGLQLVLSNSEGTLMARGRNFIRFVRSETIALSQNDYLALLIFVGGTRPSSETLASLPPPMPPAGLVPGTEKYLLGLEAARRVLPNFRTDLLGFNQAAEAQVADYLSGQARCRVMAISYPTPQIARVRFGAMSTFLGINQGRGPGSVYGKRQGSYVFLVLNADQPEAATKLIDQFKVAQQVSWDERYPGDKPFTIQVLELFLANIMLILILVALCVAGGILMFLSKRVAAKFFPEWEWGNPDSETFIRLDLK
jgi:hypothetical protein